jgi:lysophospholipase L1-like esterase
MLDNIIAMGSKPIIQLTLYRENEPLPEFIDTLNGYLKQYASNNGVAIIDLNPILTINKSLLAKYTRDGTHLTEAAYLLWAKEIIVLLKSSEGVDD